MSLFGALPRHVTVYEVGPRDGLQNETQTISTADKVDYINRLAAAGLPWIEVTSFVRPGAIPQLADAEEVVAAMGRRPGVRYSALVPNSRGMERAEDNDANTPATGAGADHRDHRRRRRGGWRDRARHPLDGRSA